jgi:hypothetical protein
VNTWTGDCVEYGRTDDVDMKLLLTHFLDLKKWTCSVTDVITMRRGLKGKPSSYLTPHNPPVS